MALDQTEHGFATKNLVTGFQRLHVLDPAADQPVKVMRSESVTIKRIPLQEAMKNSNSTAYFNALRRLNLHQVLTRLDSGNAFKFLCMHLSAAAREVRPDVVRLLFQQVSNSGQLHTILLYKD